MASPLSKIPHTTRAIRAALRNNCWGTYMQIPHEANGFRITNARTYKGVFQVRAMVTDSWYKVWPSAVFFQK